MRCLTFISWARSNTSGISSNLKKDKVLSAHRSHFHYLAKGGSLKSMIAELLVKRLVVQWVSEDRCI